MGNPEIKITIALNGEFSAVELEEIIRDLAQARSGMTPAVPGTLAGAAMMEGTSLIEQTPNFQFSTLVNGGLRIHLRSTGVGWLAFDLDADQRREMLTLISKQDANGHRSH